MEARQHPSESAADGSFSTANLRRVRRMVQALIKAGVEPWRTHDLIIGESMQHADLYIRAQQEYGALPKMVKHEVPLRADDEPVYFRTGNGSVGARRSIQGFQAYLEAPEVAP